MSYMRLSNPCSDQLQSPMVFRVLVFVTQALSLTHMSALLSGFKSR